MTSEEHDLSRENSVNDFTKELSFVDLYATMKPTLRIKAKKNPRELIKSIKELETLYFNVKAVVEGDSVPVVTVDKINELVCHETADASNHQQ